MKFLNHLKVIKLLVTKNWRIRFHHKISFGLLFLIPICFTASVVFTLKRSTSYRINDNKREVTKVISNQTNYDSNDIFEEFISIAPNYYERFDFLYHNKTLSTSVNIVYCPVNSFTVNLMKSVQNQLKNKVKHFLSSRSLLEINVNILGVENERQIVDNLQKLESISYYNKYFGIVFNMKSENERPKHLSYKISVSDESLLNYEIYHNINSFGEYYYSPPNTYLDKRFIGLQLAIDLSYISLIANTSIDDNMQYFEQKMPFPSITYFDKIGKYRITELLFTTVLTILFGLLVMLPVIVKRVVEERQTAVTDYLFLLGVSKIDHWIAIVVDAFSVIGSQHLIITFILSLEIIDYYNYMDSSTETIIHSNSLLLGINLSLFLFFSLLFIIQSILFICFISVFFKSPNIAVIATILIWIFSFLIPVYLLYGIIGRGYPALPHFGWELLSCILPNCALFWFLHISTGLEKNTNFGALWSNILEPGYLIDQMTIGHIFVTVIISYIIYGILIWYLSSVIPFKNSNPKPFYFPLKYIFQLISKHFKNNSENYESILDNENHAICVKKLTKSYKSMFGFKREKILKNIEFNVEKNSICVVLGPNGSGKTTLVNIMTGLIESKGNVLINGYNINKDQQMARNMTGICPQQNVYFKFLTLREHLVFFNELKCVLRERNDGYSGQQLIEALSLELDINKQAITLSGGTLRRMVLAMALIGPNDVLLLDEPTAALDPKVRQKVWDLIIESRKTKSILITSHHLEEANLLSDQIIIISNGKICFNGSTLQMKKEFDSGYHLKILKNNEMETENQIKESISKFVKIKKFHKNNIKENEELVFEIDFNESNKLSQMFDELQNNQSLAITELSLGMTTLEDSYAKIVTNKLQDINEILKMDSNNDNIDDNLMNETKNFKIINENKFQHILKQIFGILIKRFNYMSQHYILVLTLLIIPIIFLLLFFIAIDGIQKISKLYKRPLLLKSEDIYGNGIKAFISTNDIEFGNVYSNILKDNDIKGIYLKNNNQIEESLINYSENNLFNYFQKLLFGVSINSTINSTIIKVWYNPIAYHSLPISLNLITNTFLKQMTKESDYHITVSNSPLPIYWGESIGVNSRRDLYRSDALLIFQLLIFLFGFTFTSATYVLLPITERRNQFKLLQYMSGLKPVVYWTANFLFDLTVHSICSLIYTLVYNLFDTNQYFIGSDNSFISKYLMFLFYGFAFIPFAYMVSLIFERPSSGFTFVSLYNLIFSVIIMLLNAIIYYNLNTFRILSELLVFISPFSVFIIEMSSLHQILFYNDYCRTFDSKQFETHCSSDQTRLNLCCLDRCNSSYIFDKPRHIPTLLRFDDKCYGVDPIGYINEYILLFIIYGFIYFAIILIIEMKFFAFITKYLKQFVSKRTESYELQDMEPTEVRDEYQNVSQIVKNGYFNNYSLIVDKLSKKFNKSLIIPNNISFVVNKEECFGLLGTNGSGKTTTFRLLTGDLSITSGNAYLGLNADLINNKSNFYSRIGYCPQNDALLDRLTGMQTLLFFGRIRGLEEKEMKSWIEKMITKFELKDMINKRLSTYSGGNRRKVSLAIALMGTTQLLLLDEPTTGVDPQSRIKIWKLLRDLINDSKLSILLTSHNMYECEALCSRLAIVCDGSIKTIGFVNDLKKTYAKGFVIILKVNSDSNTDNLKIKMSEIFGDKCIIKYSNFGVIHYNLVSDDIKLSQIFKSLEIIKNQFNLEDYFVSNATLEQAFQSINQTNS